MDKPETEKPSYDKSKPVWADFLPKPPKPAYDKYATWAEERERNLLRQKPRREIWKLAYSDPSISRAQTALEAANRDLILLFDSNPIAAYARVRRMLADRRRIWVARRTGLIDRPRLKKDYIGEDE